MRRRVGFGHGATGVDDITASQLAQLAKSLGKRVDGFLVVGYADTTGTSEQNRAISEKRASSVVRAMTDSYPGTLSLQATYLGSTEKFDSQNLSKNRIVEIWSFEGAPAEEEPVEEVPVEQVPVEETSVVEEPVAEEPVEEPAVVEEPVEKPPVENSPTDEALAEIPLPDESPAPEASESVIKARPLFCAPPNNSNRRLLRSSNRSSKSIPRRMGRRALASAKRQSPCKTELLYAGASASDTGPLESMTSPPANLPN